MCNFFSCCSDGKGNVLYFKPSDVVEIMSKGNPQSYDFNSHTSVAHFHGFKGKEEDTLNKWEYNPETKELKTDKLVATDDGDKVKNSLCKFLNGIDIGYVKNLYGMNSGYRNSGYRNSGNRNSGYRNSGSMNSGDRNSGYMNSGYRNSGYMNSGDMNSGYMNSGHMNSGGMNSGDMNSGDRNSGYMNSKTVLGSLCSQEKLYLFNKPCKKEEYHKIHFIDFSWFLLCDWINYPDMTVDEKNNNPRSDVRGGYLKTIPYKEAWVRVPGDVLDEIKKLKNFNKKVFFEITGLRV